MSAKSGDSAPCRCASVLSGVPVFVERETRGHLFARFGGKQHLAPHQGCGADVKNDRPVSRRETERDRIGAESRASCARRYDVRRATGGMEADEAGVDDAFEVIGIAPAEIAVVDADGGDPALFRLGDRDFGAAIDGDIADIVAAIDEGGDGRFVYDSDGDARVVGLRVAGYCEDARQTGKAIAAKRIVDQLVGHDAGVIFAVSDAGQRGLAEHPRPVDAEPYGARPVGIEVIGTVAHAATIGRAAGTVKSERR